MSLARELASAAVGAIVGAYVLRALERAGDASGRPDGRSSALEGLERPRLEGTPYDPRAAIAGTGRYARRY